ncbi:MAG TPA: pyrroline-5-carboxylate reductase [Aggregatilineales bacterium]|nr:pyrroline-5-carboxylate reductase [Aggregatilineales bacterium]
MTTTSENITALKGLTVGFIGSGVMGEAMISGLLKQGVLEGQQVIAADVLEERGQELNRKYGIRWTLDNTEVAGQADLLVLSIKPQALDKVLPELYESGGAKPKVVLSIIAGAMIHQLSEGMGNPNVVRAMPNTPARIGQGITVWTAAKEVPEAQREQARAVLASLGDEIYMDGEDYLDMATALSGTGPAYVFMFMEAMIDAGVHMGFPRRIAEQLVIQTMRGSVEYAAASKEHPAALRNQVTSPGGTSAEAIYHLEKGGLRTVISRAVWAAYQRSVALGAGKKVSHGVPHVRNPDDLDHGR